MRAMASGKCTGGERGVVPDQATEVGLEDQQNGEGRAADDEVAPGPQPDDRHDGGDQGEPDGDVRTAGVHRHPGLLVVLALDDEQPRPEPLEEDDQRAETDHQDAVEAAGGPDGPRVRWCAS
jgi:hypothetical protein